MLCMMGSRLNHWEHASIITPGECTYRCMHDSPNIHDLWPTKLWKNTNIGQNSVHKHYHCNLPTKRHSCQSKLPQGISLLDQDFMNFLAKTSFEAKYNSSWNQKLESYSYTLWQTKTILISAFFSSVAIAWAVYIHLGSFAVLQENLII